MKRIINNVMALVLVGISTIACQEKLDTVDGKTGTGAYMSTQGAKIVFADSNQEGNTFIEPRLSHIAQTDIKITVSAEDFLQAYNKLNKTKFEALPTSQYVLYEANNPSNTSTNGKLTVTIKKGAISSRVGVRVSPLSKETFPFSKSFAIPLRIVNASANQILTDKDAIITFDRPFSTSVVTIPRGQSFKVDLDPEIPNSPNITIQAQYMFDEMTDVNGSSINMGFYGRLLPKGIQIKDGSTDTDYHKPENWGLAKWYQITFVITQDNKFKIYINGKLEQDLVRPAGGITDKIRTFYVGNTAYQWSHKYKIREIRLWNRALTEAEIKGKLYLPLTDDEEGLVAYLPLDKQEEGFVDKSKYNNTIVFRRTGDGDEISKEEFESRVTWLHNVIFPSEGLKQEK